MRGIECGLHNRGVRSVPPFQGGKNMFGAVSLGLRATLHPRLSQDGLSALVKFTFRHQLCRTLCLLLLLVFALVASAAPTVTVHPRETNAGPALTYQRLEWVVELDKTYTNCFDPEEIAVDGLFTGPDGQLLKLPGFWNQEFRRKKNARGHEENEATGKPHWLVRFAAPQAGEWEFQVRARDRSGEGNSAPLTFKVGQGKSPGFVRRSHGQPTLFPVRLRRPIFPGRLPHRLGPVGRVRNAADQAGQGRWQLHARLGLSTESGSGNKSGGYPGATTWRGRGITIKSCRWPVSAALACSSPSRTTGI